MSHVSPARTVRALCLNCCAGSPQEVRLCPAASCPFWPWRFGKNPRTVLRQHPELLDPEHVRRMGEAQCRRELGLPQQPVQIVTISPSSRDKETDHHGQ